VEKSVVACIWRCGRGILENSLRLLRLFIDRTVVAAEAHQSRTKRHDDFDRVRARTWHIKTERSVVVRYSFKVKSIARDERLCAFHTTVLLLSDSSANRERSAVFRKLFEFGDQWRVFLDNSISLASSEIQVTGFVIPMCKDQPSLPLLYTEIARRAAVGQSLNGVSANALERVLEGKVNPD